MFIQSRVQQNLSITALLILVTLLVSLVHSYAASAATNTLKVSPVRTDIQIQPGETKTVDTVVTNLTDEPITISPIENDFVAGDERGTPALILAEDEFAPTHSLKRFMVPLDDVTIPVGESRTVTVEIKVPADAQAGGYFGAVRFAPSNPDDGGQVNLAPSAASLILMTVPGDTIEQLDLTDFNVTQNGQPGSFFQSSDKLELVFRFENKGNVQVSPIGKISVTKGDEVVYESDFNTENPKDVVLPDSARRWNIPLTDIGDFGRYTATATLTYGTENKSVEVSKVFWIIPTVFIIGALAGLVVLIAVIIATFFLLKRRRNRIVLSNTRRL